MASDSDAICEVRRAPGRGVRNERHVSSPSLFLRAGPAAAVGTIVFPLPESSKVRVHCPYTDPLFLGPSFLVLRVKANCDFISGSAHSLNLSTRPHGSPPPEFAPESVGKPSL